MFPDVGQWFVVSAADPRLIALQQRHYTARAGARRGHNNTYRLVGPGENLCLLTSDGTAAFVWRHMRYRRDGQTGVECSLFRNEGSRLSSELVREAVALARGRWGSVRLFTFVNPRRVRSANPGACFLKAGWRRLDGEHGRHRLRLLELD